MHPESTAPWLAHYPPEIDWHSTLPATPVAALLAQAVARFPNRVALDFLDKRITYAELGEQVRHAAAGLQKRGVVKGSKVGLLLPNTPYAVIFYYAVLEIGGIVVNLNPLYAQKELEHHINDSGLSLLVTLSLKLTFDKAYAALQTTALKQIVVCDLPAALPPLKSLLYRLFRTHETARLPTSPAIIRFADLIANNGVAEPVAINPHTDIAVLQYTGGTTGLAKAAMLSHANVVANTWQARLWFSPAKEGHEVLLAVLPFFHVFAMTVAMNLGVLLGATLVLLPRFELRQVVQTIHRKRPSLFPAVPTIYAAIANFKELKRYNLSCIKYCISGGAGLPVDVKRVFEAVTGCVVVEGYGLSETSPVASCNPLCGLNKAGSIGQPLPQTFFEIVSVEDRTTVLPPGEKGEVCIIGPQVMQGYWNQPGETALALVDTPKGKRLHTGDVGTMDKDGYIYIIDRIKDMILCGGYKVYPRQVEEAIYLHEAVAECVVAGVPDSYRGQTVKAFIARKPGKSLTEEALLAFLKDKLSPIAMPRQIEFRASLPKTLIGKLSRKALLAGEN